MLVFQDQTHVVQRPHKRLRHGNDTKLGNRNDTPRAPINADNGPLPWCFRCCLFSHVMADCHMPQPEHDFGTDIITSDPPLDSLLYSLQEEFSHDSQPQQICKRCQDINFPHLFRMPFQPEHGKLSLSVQPPPVYGEAVDLVAELGQAETAVFLSNCPLCKLLIASALRFHPGTWQKLQILRVLSPFLTTVHVPKTMPEIDRVVERVQNGLDQSSCLFLTGSGTRPSIHPLGVRMGISLQGHSGTDKPKTASNYSRVGPIADLDLMKSWVTDCEQSHPNCQRNLGSQFLEDIRMVDVTQRMVIPYDRNLQPDYIALSYVWGLSKLEAIPTKKVLPPLPKTIEDAIFVTQKLGKPYLWVDSLCIDQRDEEHKGSQIAIMDHIYRNAWATIINLSGSSASCGLPRINTDTYIPQLRGKVGDDEYFSTHPALTAYAKQSPWSTRAWVFQEAMLSSRCLFFTHTQVYYECASHQTSELLSQQQQASAMTDKILKHESNPEFTSQYVHQKDIIQRAFCLDFSPLNSAGPMNILYRSVQIYKSLLEEYKGRNMTYFTDSLHAFSAIVHVLSKRFQTPFLSGIPVAGFSYALGWQQRVPTKRALMHYPSWSWVAWEGELRMGALDPCRYEEWQLAEDERPFFEPYFSVGEMKDGRYITLWEQNTDTEYRKPWMNTVLDVSLLKVENIPFIDNLAVMDMKTPELVVIDGIVLTFALSGFLKDVDPNFNYPVEFKVEIGQAQCELVAATKAHADIVAERCSGKPQEFLVLHRAEMLNEVRYALILLDWVDDIAYRVDLVWLKVLGEQLGQIGKANPVRKRFWFG